MDLGDKGKILDGHVTVRKNLSRETTPIEFTIILILFKLPFSLISFSTWIKASPLGKACYPASSDNSRLGGIDRGQGKRHYS